MKFYELNKEIKDFLTKQSDTDSILLTGDEVNNLLQEKDLLVDENANQAVRSILTGQVRAI